MQVRLTLEIGGTKKKSPKERSHRPKIDNWTTQKPKKLEQNWTKIGPIRPQKLKKSDLSQT